MIALIFDFINSGCSPKFLRWTGTCFARRAGGTGPEGDGVVRPTRTGCSGVDALDLVTGNMKEQT
jgi:hypothetical protein